MFSDSPCSLALGPDASSWFPRPFIGDFNNLMFHDVSFSHPYRGLHISQGTYGHFQMMFAAIAPLLMTGAYAERLSFKAFLIFSALWELFVYVRLRSSPDFIATNEQVQLLPRRPLAVGNRRLALPSGRAGLRRRYCHPCCFGRWRSRSLQSCRRPSRL